MVAQDIIFSNLQIGTGSDMVSRSATIFESWLYRLLPLLYFGSTICYHILYRVQVLLPRRKIVRRSGVYIFREKVRLFPHLAISINIYQRREKDLLIAEVEKSVSDTKKNFERSCWSWD